MKLNLPTNACDPRRLESFLSGDLSDAQERDFTLHLDTCESCRCLLAEQAAEPQVWREAEMLLKPSPFDAQSDADVCDPALATKSSRQPLQIQNVLDALGSTDDPQMLGRLGGYEVSGVVGAGGMGVVLKAIDKSLDRTVAIKVMAPCLATSGAARKRFAREAKAAAAVLHPNVIAIHSVSNDETLPYLVMPYVRGASLQKRLDREGPLSLQEILRIGAQIAAGLAVAHAQGLVHRDIKPANILLDEGVERVTITDFGLARAVDDATITHSGMIAGTPQYMSPEQARGEAVDPRSDLFSLGSVLYAVCTGRAPFRAETSYGVMRRITDDEPKAIREINPEIPTWLCQIVGKLMSKHTADRYASAGEVAELLEACLAHVQQPTAAELPASLRPVSRGSRFRSFSTRWSGVIAMVAALGLGLLGIFAWQATDGPDIAGKWSGPQWGEVVLAATGPGAYEGTYTDSVNEKPGTIRVKWSRLESRFNGTWREGQDRWGKISLRLVDNEIRGAWTTSKKSQNNPGTPELADLTWKRPSPLPADVAAGIRVRVLLSSQTHSREMLRKNIGFDQLSIMGEGITGTVNGQTHNNITAVMAHRCRLESFEETEHRGKKFWNATLFVPQDPASDGSNRDLSQKRLDGMRDQGVQFWLDHHRDQSAVGRKLTPSTTDEEIPSIPSQDQLGDALTPTQVVENGAKLYHSRQRIAVQFKVSSAAEIAVKDEKGTEHQQYDLYAEEAPKFSVRVTDDALTDLKRRGVVDVPKCFTGKWIRVKGTVYGVGLDLISRPDTLWTYHLDLNSLDQLSYVDPPALETRGQTRLRNLEGTVTDVNSQELTEISLGANDGLRAGDTLIVFRDKTYLGKITVQHVAADSSTARIDSRTGDIRRGDRVLTEPRPEAPPTILCQVRFAAPKDMLVVVADKRGLFDESLGLKAPARLNLAPGETYRLKIANIASRLGAEFYPTVEIVPTTPRSDTFLAHNAIPIQFTDEDFDQVLSGNFVIKVMYLPDQEVQELALAGVETLVSTRLDPGTDPIAEADRRGSILAVIRLGNKDVELGATPSASSKGDELSYSETKEIVLSMDSLNFMLDFDSGKTMDMPARVGRPEQEQMDVQTDQVQPYHYPKELIGLGLQGVEVKASDWDASAVEVRRALASDRVEPLKQMDLGPEKHPTYFFKTRHGAYGVLQLLELVDKPKGIRLRYKTVKAVSAGSPAREPTPSQEPRRRVPDLQPEDEKPNLETPKPADGGEDEKPVKPQAGKPQPPKNPEDVRLRMNFSNTPWKDVVEWLAKEADLSVVADSFPPGTINYHDTRVYTVPQSIDLLNRVLRTRGFILLHKDRMLVVWNLEDGAVPSDIPSSVSPLKEKDDPMPATKEGGEAVLPEIMYRLPFAFPSAEEMLQVLPAKVGSVRERIQCELLECRIDSPRIYPCVGRASLATAHFKCTEQSVEGRDVAYINNSHLVLAQ